MKLINLTRHDITLYAKQDTVQDHYNHFFKKKGTQPQLVIPPYNTVMNISKKNNGQELIYNGLVFSTNSNLDSTLDNIPIQLLEDADNFFIVSRKYAELFQFWHGTKYPYIYERLLVTDDKVYDNKKLVGCITLTQHRTPDSPEILLMRLHGGVIHDFTLKLGINYWKTHFSVLDYQQLNYLKQLIEIVV